MCAENQFNKNTCIHACTRMPTHTNKHTHTHTHSHKHIPCKPSNQQNIHLFVSREHEIVSGLHVDLQLLHVCSAIADEVGQGQQRLDATKGWELKVHRDGDVLDVHCGQGEGGAHVRPVFPLSESFKHKIHEINLELFISRYFNAHFCRGFFWFFCFTL